MAQSEIHSGLINLGQTCYLNSSLQVLRAIEPLRDALERSARASSPLATHTDPLDPLASILSSTPQRDV